MIRSRPVALLGLVLISACTAASPIETVEDLIKALENKGISFETADRIDLSGMAFAQIDEGVRLTGNELRVEILRVEDDRTFQIVSSMGSLLKILNEKLGDAPIEPPDVITRHPFVVVVRAEPEPGRIRGILDRVLPAPKSD
jgi:hypothetical protein